MGDQIYNSVFSFFLLIVNHVVFHSLVGRTCELSQ